MSRRLTLLQASDIAGRVTAEAIGLLPRLFGDRDADGVRMAVRAAGEGEEGETIAASLVTLVEDLTAELPASGRP